MGYFNKQKRDELIERQGQWLSYVAVADLKKHPMTIDKWWPINGERVAVKRKPPTKERLLELTSLFKNFGKQKNANG